MIERRTWQEMRASGVVPNRITEFNLASAFAASPSLAAELVLEARALQQAAAANRRTTPRQHAAEPTASADMRSQMPKQFQQQVPACELQLAFHRCKRIWSVRLTVHTHITPEVSPNTLNLDRWKAPAAQALRLDGAAGEKLTGANLWVLDLHDMSVSAARMAILTVRNTLQEFFGLS